VSKGEALIDLVDMTDEEVERYLQKVDDDLLALCSQWVLDEKTQGRIADISGKLSDVAGTFDILEDADDLLLVGFNFVVTHMEEVGREAQKSALNHLASKMNFVFHFEDLEE